MSLVQFGLFADVRLPGVFSSNMMLQRDVDITIWGWADPKESIEVTFQEQSFQTKANQNGEWSTSIGTNEAGGPYEISIRGDNELVIRNILFGDVWLCSGQSNMDWGLSGDAKGERAISKADYPNIRLFKVGKVQSQHPKPDMQGSWEVCSPETVSDFSAVAYYFGKEIFESRDIPIGLIQASWGGSAITTWMSSDALDHLPGFSDDKQLLQSKSNFLKIKEENFQVKLDAWFEEVAKNSQLLKEKNSLDPQVIKLLNWQKTEMPKTWEKTAVGDVDGLVWYKTSLDDGGDFRNDSLTYLSLGKLDDHDMVYYNERLIGHAGWKEWNRFYFIPDSLIKNHNELVVGIVDYGGEGGFAGNANDLFVESISGNGQKARFPLPTNWEYYVENYMPQMKPIWLGGIHEPTFLYNAMLAPLTGYPIKGVAWYQGERSKGNPEGYDLKLKTLINDWRDQWEDHDLPFIFVQLPNYANEPGQYPKGNWAELRALQAKALELPRTGMAVTYDVGNPYDIHPLNKEPVGHRLALLARDIVYNENIVSTGPTVKELNREKNTIQIHFETSGEKLVVKNTYGYVKGFQIGYKKNKKLRMEYVQAKVSGDFIKIEIHGHPEVDVIRYAWEDNPEANLYNESGLPAPPFEYWFNKQKL